MRFENNTIERNLNKTFIERNSLNESSKLDKILSDRDIGDRKPSEFYRSPRRI